jgi:hypothetical protein
MPWSLNPLRVRALRFRIVASPPVRRLAIELVWPTERLELEPRVIELPAAAVTSFLMARDLLAPTATEPLPVRLRLPAAASGPEAGTVTV